MNRTTSTKGRKGSEGWGDEKIELFKYFIIYEVLD